MAMMAAAHTAVGAATGFVALVFVAGLFVYLWGRPR
jgi:hypothetical protein